MAETSTDMALTNTDFMGTFSTIMADLKEDTANENRSSNVHGHSANPTRNRRDGVRRTFSPNWEDKFSLSSDNEGIPSADDDWAPSTDDDCSSVSSIETPDLNDSEAQNCVSSDNKSDIFPIPNQGSADLDNCDVYPEGNIQISKKYSWNKRHCCKFCKKMVLRMSRHLKSLHIHEPEVEAALVLPKQSVERKKALLKLLHEGDYQHNYNVYQSESGELITKYRSTKNIPQDFVVCHKCKALYLRHTIASHLKRCVVGADKDVLTDGQAAQMGSSMLLPSGRNKPQDRLSSSSNWIPNTDNDEIPNTDNDGTPDTDDDGILNTDDDGIPNTKFYDYCSSIGRVGTAETETCVPSDNKRAVFSRLNQCDTDLAQYNMCPKANIQISKKHSWSKRHCCKFCKKMVIKISRHLKSNHVNEPEVEAALVLPKDSVERKKALLKLLHEGDYQHNYNVYQSESGELITKYRSTKNNPQDLIVCYKCKALYPRHTIIKHTKQCVLNIDKDVLKNGEGTQTSSSMLPIKNAQAPQMDSSMSLPIGGHISSSMYKNVIRKMRKDNITQIVMGDKLIIQYGEQMAKQTEPQVSSRMRELGRLLKLLQDNSQLQVSTLSAALDPDNFDLLISCVRQLANFNEFTHAFKNPHLVLRLGSSLKKCGEIGKDAAGNENDTALEEKMTLFQNLYDSRWYDSVSAYALQAIEKPELKYPSHTPLLVDRAEMSYDMKDVQLDDRATLASATRSSIDPTIEIANDSNGNSTRIVTSQHEGTDGRTPVRARKRAKKKRWSKEEIAGVKKHLSHCFDLNKVPQKHEVDKAIAAEPVLKQRSWRDIKYCVYNLLRKRP